MSNDDGLPNWFKNKFRISNNDRRRYIYGSAALIGLIGIFCVYKFRVQFENKRLINYFVENRRMINVGIQNNKLPRIRVMSYNILADGTRYALGDKFDYVALKYRKWSYRFPRIMAQINALNPKPDIICLQETTYETYHNSLKIEFDLMGYGSIHCVRDLDAQKSGLSHQTDTIIYNKNKFTLLNSKIIRLNKISDNDQFDKYFGDKESYFRGTKLKQSSDVVIVLHLKLKNSGYEFIACTSHLYWNPKFPHIKLSQTLLINHSLYNLITNEWNLNIKQIPIVFGIDANAMPLKTKPDRYDVHLDDNGTTSMISGVYKLMTNCKVDVNHVDHPKSRIFEKVYRSIYYEKLREELEQKQTDDEVEEEDDNKNDAVMSVMDKSEEEIIAEKRGINISELEETCTDIEKYPKLKELEYARNIIDYETNIRWKSVYGTAGDEPIFTNKVPGFSETIDYIFVNDGFRVLSYLEMPYQNSLNYHVIDLDSMNNPNKNGNVNNEQRVKTDKEKEIENAKNFSNLPNDIYPSDHLSLVTDLEFMPRSNDIKKVLQQLK